MSGKEYSSVRNGSAVSVYGTLKDLKSRRRSRSRARSARNNELIGALPYSRTPRLTVPQREEVRDVLANAAHGPVNRVKVGAAVAAGVVISALGAIWAVWWNLPKATQEAAIKYFNVTEPFNPTKPYLGFKSVKKTQKKSRTRKVSKKVSKKSRKVSHKKSPKKH